MVYFFNGSLLNVYLWWFSYEYLRPLLSLLLCIDYADFSEDDNFQKDNFHGWEGNIILLKILMRWMSHHPYEVPLITTQLVVAGSHSSSLFPSGYAHATGLAPFHLKNRAASFLLHAMNVHHSWAWIKWTLKAPFLGRARGTWRRLWGIMNLCCNWPSRMKKTDNLVSLTLALRSQWDL